MADIFISYARQDRELAKMLARALTNQGYQIWWDAELVGSDDFRDVILEELDRSNAVIVIWTKNSIRSKFVRDEASRADRSNKLIAACASGFDTKTIPLGFGGQHCHDVMDVGLTIKALSRLNVVVVEHKLPNEKQQIEAERKDWENIKNSKNPYDYLNFISTYSDGLHRARAAITLRSLTAKKAVKIGYKLTKVGLWCLVFFAIAALITVPLVILLPNDGFLPAVISAVDIIAALITYLIYRSISSKKERLAVNSAECE